MARSGCSSCWEALWELHCSSLSHSQVEEVVSFGISGVLSDAWLSPACMKCCFSHPHWSPHPWVLSHPYQAQQVRVFIHAEDLDCYIYHMITVCRIQQSFGKAKAKKSLVNRSAVRGTEAWLPSLPSALAWSHPTFLTLLSSCRFFFLSFFYAHSRVNVKFQMSGWLNCVFEDPSECEGP